ncbi:furin-1-like isoform X2 [Styela clava]
MAPYLRRNINESRCEVFSYLRLFANPIIPKTPSCMAAIFIMVFAFGYCNAESAVHYANQWVVEIDGGDIAADEIATLYGFRNFGKLFEDGNAYKFYHPSVMKRSISESHEHNSKLTLHPMVRSAEQQIIKSRVKRDLTHFTEEDQPKDPLWPKTWYLLPTIRPSMKVFEAWEEGYTGKGVVVTILDDGIEYKHPDLAANFDLQASKDVNDHDDDPAPRDTYSNENRHGTRCAGEVAAVADNKYCSVGIAYKASIGGVRMLDGQVTDLVEAESIGLRPNHIDIYSASWGPDDDGKTVDGPARRAKEAFEKGVTLGRGGLGSIFVWASGNGGKRQDNCNCDGYTNSIYTLSISSTTEHTQTPWYSEDCSSTLATTYSSGIDSDRQIVTTDLHKKCTQSHTGTSASAPLAAGICALALEANKNLTWRDMQHIVVQTANPDGLTASDWALNAVGRKVSHSYGYGLMDAHAMVLKAKSWKTVPQQRKCNITILHHNSKSSFSRGKPLKITFNVNTCEGVMPDRLEHVQAEISASCDRRGDMNIYLTSAMGTNSTLLDSRQVDLKSGGFSKWPFMTTHSWDENPVGSWTLEVHTHGVVTGTGSVSYFNLILYGTLNKDWSAGLVENVQTSTTSVASSKIASSPVTEVYETNNEVSTTPSHCKITKSNNLCIVCEDGYVRSHDGLSCLTSCPDGQYLSSEWVDEAMKAAAEKLPRTNEDHDNLESDNDGYPEKVNVCVVCDPGFYCTSCHGPEISDCSKCIDGFNLVNGECILEKSENQELHRKIFGLTIAVCIFSVIIFVFLFVSLHYCRKQNKHCCYPSSTKPLYSYVPNGIDNDEELDGARYYSNGTIGFVDKKRGKPNGSALKDADMNQGLLDESDDGRT